MKKSEIAKLDQLFRTVGKPQICELCTYFGKQQNSPGLVAHHFIGRANKRLRWDTRNRVWLCVNHHTAESFSAHKSPEWFKKQLLSLQFETQPPEIPDMTDEVEEDDTL